MATQVINPDITSITIYGCIITVDDVIYEENSLIRLAGTTIAEFGIGWVYGDSSFKIGCVDRDDSADGDILVVLDNVDFSFFGYDGLEKFIAFINTIVDKPYMLVEA